MVKAKPTPRYFTYLIFSRQGRVYIHKRSGGDIWQNLHEFLLMEEKEFSPEKQFLGKKTVQRLIGKVSTKFSFSPKIYKQQLTHQTIHARFLHIKTGETFIWNKAKDLFPVALNDLKQYAFPKIILQYLNETDFLQRLK